MVAQDRIASTAATVAGPTGRRGAVAMPDGMVLGVHLPSPAPTPTPRPQFRTTQIGAALAAIVLLAVLAVAPLPATGQAGAVHSPTPAPHSVVEAGSHPVGAVLEGIDGVVQIAVDGALVEGPTTTDDLGRTLTDVALPPGRHLVEVRVDGVARREWPVLVSGVRTRTVARDPASVGLVASGPPAPYRTVLLANPDTPALALAAGPLGSATGAVLLPAGQAELPAATREALLEAEADTVMLLGGLDAIGPDVAADLTAAGYEVQRIGSGSPADVAAAAAGRAAHVQVYRRDGTPQPRPVLLAPSDPPAAALQAAADATRRGASLLLADGDALSADTTRILSQRTTVWLADGLSGGAADAARTAAPADATVTAVPAAGGTAAPAASAGEIWIVDDHDPAAVLAVRAAGPDVDVVLGRAPAREVVARDRPPRVTVVGTFTDAPTVSAWWVDGPAAPQVTAELDPGATPTVTLTVDRVPQAHAIHVSVRGREWPGSSTVEDRTITWRAGARPALPDGLEPSSPTEASLVVTAVVAADDAERHLHLAATTTIGAASSTSTEGFAVAGGQSQVVGSGPLRTFTIEIEPATGLDLAAVTQEATAILLDAERGWTTRDQRSMQRISDPAAADIRVVVARPVTVDAFCRRVGLDTGGRLSCWDGRRAMLNLTRWNTGVSPFHTDVAVYRQYLVSHEVGHGLGYGHVGCPAAGALAPVMMQQSKGLGACVANGWPYPDG